MACLYKPSSDWYWQASLRPYWRSIIILVFRQYKRSTFMNRRLDSKGCNVSSFIHGSFSVDLLTISLDPIKCGFIGVERGNDKIQFETFLKVLGFRVQRRRLSKNSQKRLFEGFNPHFLKNYMRWTTFELRFVSSVRKSIENTMSLPISRPKVEIGRPV